MNIKLYKSLLTGRRTWVCLDNAGIYGLTYLEAQVRYGRGYFLVCISDGFRIVTIRGTFTTLKEALNWSLEQIVPVMQATA